MITVKDYSTVFKGHVTTLQQIVKGCELQIIRDYCKSYNMDSGYFKSILLSVNDPHPGQEFCRINIYDDAPQKGILADHDLGPKGIPYQEIFAKTILDNGGSMTGPNGVSSALSHEFLEMMRDRLVNLWLDTSGLLKDKDGKTWQEVADEACDSVEDTGYKQADTGIYVSNFITQEWDNVKIKSARRDYMGLLDTAKPFGWTSGGYMIVRNEPGEEEDIFADRVNYPQWKLDKKKNPVSRNSLRKNAYSLMNVF